MSNDISRMLKKARDQGRLTTLEYAELVFDDFMKLHGDRHFAGDGAIVDDIARLDGRPVIVISAQKGKNLQENLEHNFGQPNSEGHHKALRLTKRAGKFGRLVVAFINTAGAYPGVGAKERGQGKVIAHSLLEMSDLKVPIIVVVVGERDSDGVLALVVAGKVRMLEHNMYVVLDPEGLTPILWKGGSHVTETAELIGITAGRLYNMGVVDRVIPGHGCLSNEIVGMIGINLIIELNELSQLPLGQLPESRYQRFRKY